jgi:hypothetical protein
MECVNIRSGDESGNALSRTPWRFTMIYILFAAVIVAFAVLGSIRKEAL